MHLNIIHKCKSCKFEASSKIDLKKHIDNVHEQIEVVVENYQEDVNETGKVIYQCQECEFQTNDKKSLKSHFEKEHGPKVK